MNKPVIFSGTTEGRVLSDMLAREGIRHIVCVATDYGRKMMDKNACAKVHVGRMNAEEMADFLSESNTVSIIVDATHPYAVEVTDNIKRAAGRLGIRVVRVVREQEGRFHDGVFCYKDTAECAAVLDETAGNILLTTGSKELGTFFAGVSEEMRARTYVRVLPSVSSLKICEAAHIEPSRIIAMQGPFGRELNEALMKQYDIRHLVTKESGNTGGYEEKISAAAGAGAQVHVIMRPGTETGLSVSEAFRIIAGKDVHPSPDAKPLKIALIGVGMGNPDCMTGEAAKILSRCDAVFGAKRLLESISCDRKYEMYRADEIIPVLSRGDITCAAVAFSGDTGFFSGAKRMREALLKWRDNIEVRMVPGISSFSYLAARCGLGYDDACLASIHGRNTDRDIGILLDKVRYNRKVFILLSGDKDIHSVAERLIGCGIKGSMIVGANLSYKNEAVREISFEEARNFKSGEPVCAVILNANPAKRTLINIKRDDDFVRGKVPMTKECVRHESIIRLGLKEDDIFYDIGGGTGSIAVEAAALHPSLQVFTIEKDREAAGLIRQNVMKAGLANVTVLEGDAEDMLADMAKPDCVFIGGTGGRLRRIMGMLREKGSGIRYVINAVTVETIAEVRAVLDAYGPDDEEAVMISVSDIKSVGSFHMHRAQNPVWIFSFTM